MINRRSLLAATLLVPAAAHAQSGDPKFAAWLAGLRAEAKRAGVDDGTLNAALSSVEQIPLVLDQPGETLIPRTGGGEIEGRSAWFDLSLDGRWGGVISGDRIRIDYGKCPCGHQGPTVADDVTRYADMPGGDKITCSATIDAYVRGVA